MSALIYEVNLSVEASIADQFNTWLAKHVPAVCACPGMLDATVWRVDSSTPDRVEICVQYRVESRAALDRYLREFAPALRQDGVDGFGAQFSATRRVMEPNSASYWRPEK
jgi:hypothetical protein